jgi:alpha,alpha-trehalase
MAANFKTISMRTLNAPAFLLGSRRSLRAVHTAILIVLLTSISLGQAAGGPPQPAVAPAQPGLTPILNYISSGWDTLTRSMSKCDTVVDPKLVEDSVLYLPAHFPEPDSLKEMKARCHIRVLELPQEITGPGQVATVINPPGLLYLAHDYVVPGGRFNEMYGWDSYFIIHGLVENGRVDLARGMVNNFLFEIEHYGTILNANRTYYLTRSQPPFLTSEILSVYNADQAAGHEDREWLAKAYALASKDYEMWNREPHLAGDTGLSRYFDFGKGPAEESLKDETGYYRKVTDYFLLHSEGRNYIVDRTGGKNKEDAVGSEYTVQVCDVRRTMARPDCNPERRVSLSADYYKGDRADRESGFDITFRFGPYAAATHHIAPICLNSLLYKTERDLEHIAGMLHRIDEAKRWERLADERRERIQKYLWDAKRGLFTDYNVETKAQSDYEYITTFYPLWAGLATPEQARAVMKNVGMFEHAGGLAMSRHETGAQWDLPYGWAPTQMIAIEGIRRYGFKDDADRLSYAFLGTVVENFRRDGTIREKYNVLTRSTESQVEAGYNQNVIGFGWTNGAFLTLLHALPRNLVERLEKDDFGGKR